MFFVLSKVLSFFIQPLNWILGLLLFALFSKKPKRKKRCLLIAIIAFWFFSNHFIFNHIVRVWEPDTLLMSELQQTYDVGILLGGYSNFSIIPKQDRYNLSERANRLTQAIELYKKGYFKNLLITGGSGSLLQNKPSEAIEVQSFLRLMGIPDSVIIIEAASRNTHENALFSKRLLDEQFPNANCLLITSAWHMRRAKGCFDKEGVHATAFCVDYMSEEHQFIPATLLFPNSYTFYRWGLLIKEWVGYIVYQMKGYI